MPFLIPKKPLTNREKELYREVQFKERPRQVLAHPTRPDRQSSITEMTMAKLKHTPVVSTRQFFIVPPTTHLNQDLSEKVCLKFEEIFDASEDFIKAAFDFYLEGDYDQVYGYMSLHHRYRRAANKLHILCMSLEGGAACAS